MEGSREGSVRAQRGQREHSENAVKYTEYGEDTVRESGIKVVCE